ncbi:MAG: hypothetical protein DA328_06860 [Nitrososphaeraceae archaeon]|nr:hypothetical protein [Nitrososphaeraceae archaeon]
MPLTENQAKAFMVSSMLNKEYENRINYKILMFEQDDKLKICVTSCKICDKSLVKGLYKYRNLSPDNIKHEKYYEYLMFCCRKHPEEKIIMSPEELDKLNEYKDDDRIFTFIRN